MFLDLDKHNQSSLAVIDDSGREITYGEICSFSEKFYSFINRKTLIFILSENTIGSLAGYVASLSGKIVPLLVSRNTDSELLEKLIDLYKPEYLWVPEAIESDFQYQPVFNSFAYTLLKTGLETYSLYNELSLLLPTSGSTGSPKLVRHSYTNIEQNARNVASFFELKPAERPIAILPMHYTMGLSVITSHLYAGSTILLAKGNLTEKEFWQFVRENRATSFTGVPFSFEILYRLRFFRMNLPDLTLLTQGGGKLSTELFHEFADFAEKTGKKFIATYGQTEGSARMAYLPADMATTKTGSIGKAIPNGELYLIDDNGNTITETEASGQLVYRGLNVTLGYALCGEDLIKGDENNGVLLTGDIAKRDADGYYYIIGRMKRFLKLYGLRISLDEIEQMVKSAFNLDCLCTGNDDQMRILITEADKAEAVIDYIVEKTGLFQKAIEITIVNEIPKNEAGKTIYTNNK